MRAFRLGARGSGPDPRTGPPRARSAAGHPAAARRDGPDAGAAAAGSPRGRGFWILATIRAPGRLGRDAPKGLPALGRSRGRGPRVPTVCHARYSSPGRQVPRFCFFPARAVGHGQQGGHSQHQPVAAHADRVRAAGLVPSPADGLQAPEALLNPVAAGNRVGSVCAIGVSVSSTQGCA